MLLKEHIKEALVNAQKIRDQWQITTLRGVVNVINLQEKDLKRELNDLEVVAVLQQAIKKCKDPIEKVQKQSEEVQSKYQSKVDSLLHEIDFLSKFLPTQLTEEELKNKILEIMNTTSLSGLKIGAVMGKVMSQLKGKAENKLISKVVSDLVEGKAK